jgi:carbonyl reductase 1
MASTRTAVVTGANRGIGAAIAAQLVARGLRVLGTRRSPDGAGEDVSRAHEFALLDVTRRDQIDALARHPFLESGFDVLVNNAGASEGGFDAEVARRTLEVNFFGAMNVTDALLPLLRQGGRIVMVSSGMGELSHVRGAVRRELEDPALTRPLLVALLESFAADVERGTHERHGWPSSAYSVSKVGLNALVRVMARELAGDPRRILINAACPGWVRTRMGGSSAPRSVEHGARTPVWLALLPPDGPQGGFFRDERAIPW